MLIYRKLISILPSPLQKVGAVVKRRLVWWFIAPIFATLCQWRCKKKIKSLRRNNAKIIRVAFLQMYATSNQDLRIFELMLKDPLFEPYFIVNPDISRSCENARVNYDRTMRELQENYGEDRVLEGVSADGSYIDYSQRFDLMTTNNPYDAMAAKPFRIKHWAILGTPVFYTSYFYMGRCRVSVENIRMLSSGCVWRFFADNEAVLKMAQKHSILKGRNFVLTGSPKMDGYANVVPRSLERPMVLVAPHHSIGNTYPQNSAFLDYANDLLDVMRTFKDIDFVFRPHPLLIENLKNDEYWGVEATESFVRQLQQLPNVEFSNTGDYLQGFADSSALIHDCGSFSAEYLFTDKPCAYIVRKSVDMTTFSDLGRKCIEAHYQVRNRDDLISFLDTVVRRGVDCMKESRMRFAHEELMYNYPHVSEAIVEDLKNVLGWKGKV